MLEFDSEFEGETVLGRERRTKMEVVMDILSEALNGANKTRIMYRANLNFVRFNRYLEELLSKGLIEEVRSNPEGFVIYRTTESGRAFLRVLREAHGYMSV